MQSINILSLVKTKNIHRPLIFHSFLWILAFAILIFVFTKGKRPVGIDYIYTTVFLVLMAIPVCINFYVLIPKVLKKESYILYFLWFSIITAVFGMLMYVWFQSFIDILFPSYFFISYLTNNNLVIVITIFLVCATLLRLGEDWFHFNSNRNKLLRLQNRQFETQLSALRSQINPHFLFNSLNVIYAMAIEKKDNITSAIVELSDILRYVIYDSDTNFISLKDELKLIKNYIAFQKHRVKHFDIVDLDINVENENYQIYPLLLLPLLENAYKYGLSSSNDVKPITIKIKQKNTHFMFSIQNSKENIDLDLDKNYSGIGLKTLRDNLNLIYPKQHDFKINDTETQFGVILKLNNVHNQ